MAWLTSEESIGRYKDALRRAVSTESVFSSFRRESGVREIVEGIPDVAGMGYYDKLAADDNELLSRRWSTIVVNDHVGEPKLMSTPHGIAAPTTMRYAWNVRDMENRGVVLDGVDVVEVGGGYGGLCRMVYAFHTPRSYTIVDLPEALNLARRYLSCFGISFRAVEDSNVGLEPIDTFISNYALTELTRDVQDVYVSKLMSRARHGYVTYNSQPRNAGQQYTLMELADNLTAGSVNEIFDENVKRSECRVLVWSSP